MEQATRLQKEQRLRVCTAIALRLRALLALVAFSLEPPGGQALSERMGSTTLQAPQVSSVQVDSAR
jgi:hypothetical protein